MKALHVSPVLLATLALSATLACGSDPEGEGGSDGVNVDGETPDPSSPVPEPVSCGLNTNFAGDANCILPPDPEEGMQLHIGPSSYDDPDVINAQDEDGNYLWIMMPGDERTNCYHTTLPNEESIHYFRQKYRMRAGSHHMILSLSQNTDPTPGWGLCQGGIINAIGGTQHVVEDFPPNGIVAPEDEGLARGIPARQPLDAQLHFYNVTDEPQLREIWVNYYYKPADEVTMNLGMLGGFTRMNVPPHTRATVSNVCKAEQAIGGGDVPRIVTLFGHAHSHNERFVVYHGKADGSEEVIYDSYDGAEAPTYMYNSLVQLPAPDPVNRISGGRSGILALSPGEQLRFECDVNNTTDFTFRGQNEVNTDEMCHLFGSVAGAGFPCFSLAGR